MQIQTSIKPIDSEPTNSIWSVIKNLGIFKRGSNGNEVSKFLSSLDAIIGGLGKIINEIMKTRNSSPPMKKNGSSNPLKDLEMRIYQFRSF